MPLLFEVMTDELEAIGKGLFMNSVPEGKRMRSTVSVGDCEKRRVGVSELVNGIPAKMNLKIARLGRRWFPFPEATDCMVQGLCINCECSR